MRIRTIKPDFWSHPVMTRLDDAARLLAIGLLNFADDEGYFFATPALVRSALRPLDDDSTIVRRCLAQLSEIGYLRIVEHPTHGPIGLVLSFGKHQRVDRPKPSDLSSMFSEVTDNPSVTDSTNDRRMIDERSSLEGKGKEQGKEGNTPLPPEGGSGPVDPKKSAWSPTETQLRVAGWFRRRESTPWSERERKAWRGIVTTDSDLDLLEGYYTAEIPSRSDYRRRDLLTLLNNWTGEIDRARRFAEETKPRSIEF